MAKTKTVKNVGEFKAPKAQPSPLITFINRVDKGLAVKVTINKDTREVTSEVI